MSKMKIGTLKFQKGHNGNWETHSCADTFGYPGSICYQGLRAVTKTTFSEKQYYVDFYNRKPRGPHFAVELKGSKYRRVGSKGWNTMNFDLQRVLNDNYDYPLKEIVYFKIKAAK